MPVKLASTGIYWIDCERLSHAYWFISKNIAISHAICYNPFSQQGLFASYNVIKSKPLAWRVLLLGILLLNQKIMLRNKEHDVRFFFFGRGVMILNLNKNISKNTRWYNNLWCILGFSAAVVVCHNKICMFWRTVAGLLVLASQNSLPHANTFWKWYSCNAWELNYNTKCTVCGMCAAQ